MSSPKRKQAVALAYEPNSSHPAPEVVAKGSGLVADRILALAKEHGVAIHEDRDLVEVLSKLDLGQQIPDTLYTAVARILAKIYTANENLKNKI